MRKLAKSTVIRTLKQRGWHWDDQWFRYSHYGHVVITGEFWHGEGLKFFDARLVGHPNVHIVSYWGPFRSLKELSRKLDEAEAVYSELCHITPGGQ